MRITFAYPYFLLLLLCIPLVWMYLRHKFSVIPFSHAGMFKGLPSSYKIKFGLPGIKLLRSLVLALWIIALARPQLERHLVKDETEGVDILLVLDVSSSMLAEDFEWQGHRQNRLQVVKRVVGTFIEQRRGDRIGLVMFAGEAMTVCPLTLDIGVLEEFLKTVQNGILEDGTAIGDALGFATNRFMHSGGKSKVMVLLTDGDNTAGKIDPTLGAKLAQSQGIRIYTIGVGRNGPVPVPIEHPLFGKTYVEREFPLNEALLEQIAGSTQGKYFRASNTEQLIEVYDEIDQLEKTKMESYQYREYDEYFHYFLLLGIVFLLLELLLSECLIVKVP